MSHHVPVLWPSQSSCRNLKRDTVKDDSERTLLQAVGVW